MESSPENTADPLETAIATLQRLAADTYDSAQYARDAARRALELDPDGTRKQLRLVAQIAREMLVVMDDPWGDQDKLYGDLRERLRLALELAA